MSSNTRKQSDEEAIRSWFDTYLSSVVAGDLDTYLASWSDDMIFLPPDQSIKIGKESCREIAEGILHYDIEPDVTIEEIVIDDELAFARLSVKEKFTPKAGGASFEVDIKSVWIFRRQLDGSWLGTHCIWNSNKPPQNTGGG